METVNSWISLDVQEPIWDRCFGVHPVVIVGTQEPDGSPNLAPKHLAMPMSWENYFGFICTPTHATERNARRTGCFTVSFPRPDQILFTSMAAAPRCDDDRKHGLDALPTMAASVVEGVLLEGASVHLECALDRVVEGLGPNHLIVGQIAAARIAEDVARALDRDDQDLIATSPLLAYLHPGRYAVIDRSNSFPFHSGFSR